MKMMKVCVAILVALVVSVAHAENLTGRVVGVSDGDTITILQAGNVQAKIRLAGIDAPEKSQSFGQVAKAALSDLVFNKTVIVGVQDTDRYGRTVGWVSVDGVDINAQQVKSGMAWVYRQYIDQSSMYGKSLLALEHNAREERRGLWLDESPMEPKLFRKQKATATN